MTAWAGTVILFVRMWVEMILIAAKGKKDIRSSSSWGCELKCCYMAGQRQPTESSSSWGCELKYARPGMFDEYIDRHPLREDVSWNNHRNIVGVFVTVILFVRMWVEMRQPCGQMRWWNSHPLREDVSWNMTAYLTRYLNNGHPLREDVSWNYKTHFYKRS